MNPLTDAIMGRRVTLGRVVSLRLTAKSDLKVVEQIVREVVNFLTEQARPSEPWLLTFSLCLRETVYNAVMHGNRHQRDLAVDIQTEFNPGSGRVVLTVRDGGHGFDWRAALDREASQGIDRPRGRGLVILSELTDEVQVANGEVRFTLTVPESARKQDGEGLHVA